ncbi:MAG: hypothetical protein VX498_02535, partial [Myxococcota bacterium]|nr:hypothetical protein [Myxococcota bacterium]
MTGTRLLLIGGALASLGLVASGCPAPCDEALDDACSDDENLYVDDLGDGEVGDGSSADPYRSLQDAVDAAVDGQTIRIKPGHYEAIASDSIDPTCGNC